MKVMLLFSLFFTVSLLGAGEPGPSEIFIFSERGGGRIIKPGEGKPDFISGPTGEMPGGKPAVVEVAHEPGVGTRVEPGEGPAQQAGHGRP